MKLFLMIICYTHRLVPSPTIIREALSSIIQQLVGADAETYIPTLIRVKETPQKMRRKDCRSKRNPRHHGNMTHIIN